MKSKETLLAENNQLYKKRKKVKTAERERRMKKITMIRVREKK